MTKTDMVALICCDAQPLLFDVVGCRPWAEARPHATTRVHHVYRRLGDVALVARAQQGGNRYTIGILSAGGAGVQAALNSAFFDGLRELGWVEGKNVAFENRNAENQLERLPELAADLVRLKVDVIAASGTLAPLAVKQATKTIPIVMTAAGDPLGSGLVASLARPGGNVTGMSLMVPDLGAKRLELLKEVLPRFSRVAVLWNAANPYSALVFKETQAGGGLWG
jgi:putative tryptophan/tyrosine transport system substrate-binding protein